MRSRQDTKSRQSQRGQARCAKQPDIDCYVPADRAVLAGAVMACLVHNEGHGNGQNENQSDAKQKSACAFPACHLPFPPF
jgi:hypothetical protein